MIVFLLIMSDIDSGFLNILQYIGAIHTLWRWVLPKLVEFWRFSKSQPFSSYGTEGNTINASHKFTNSLKLWQAPKIQKMFSIFQQPKSFIALKPSTD